MQFGSCDITTKPAQLTYAVVILQARPLRQRAGPLSICSTLQHKHALMTITIAQTLLENGLVSGLKNILPNLDPSTISGGGASAVRDLVSSDQLPMVLRVYNDAIRSVWYLGLGLACLVFVASWGFEWKSVKAKRQNSDNDKA